MLTIKDFEAKFDKATKDAKPIEVGAAMAAIVARELVRELGHLSARLDKTTQQLSAANARIAALERRGQA
ncbi:MAG: hypothetical protein ABJD97_08030 [Betaproteobacteria bacterium]